MAIQSICLVVYYFIMPFLVACFQGSSKYFCVYQETAAHWFQTRIALFFLVHFFNHWIRICLDGLGMEILFLVELLPFVEWTVGLIRREFEVQMKLGRLRKHFFAVHDDLWLPLHDMAISATDMEKLRTKNEELHKKLTEAIDALDTSNKPSIVPDPLGEAVSETEEKASTFEDPHVLQGALKALIDSVRTDLDAADGNKTKHTQHEAIMHVIKHLRAMHMRTDK